MELQLKDITLKEDTYKDMKNKNTNTSLFIKTIKMNLENARFLHDNNMKKMDSIDLYKALKKVFDIKLDIKDYIKILSMKNKKHYSKKIRIKTTMFDNNNNNILYDCIAASKADLEENDRLDLRSLRRLTNSEDLLLLKEYRIPDDLYKGKVEKQESFHFLEFNIENTIIDEDSELFQFIIEYIQKQILVKDVLYDLKQYIIELEHQRTELSLKPDKNKYKTMAIAYKNAYDESRQKKEIPDKPKISVRYPTKVKTRKKVKTRNKR